jgi:type I restriction enzyme, R subunit
LRLHAVRYKQAIDGYIKRKGYSHVAALVAFSGEVIDPDVPDEPFTESKMNAFPETETAARFLGTPPHDPTDYQVMVVAEKFQTGFDAPLLHTMFVDKKLDGVNAVQTLSRLNRTHPGKSTTFVLDFANDAEDIQKAFTPYYDVTLATETEPERLYDTWRRVEDHLVVHDEDVDRFARVWFSLDDPDDERQHPSLYAALKPCEDRFPALDAEAQEAFRRQLGQFVRLYAFLSQVLTFTDTTMEKRYALGRLLAHRLRDPNAGSLDLGDDVSMEFFKIAPGDEEQVSVDGGGAELTAFTGDGTLRATEEELVLLSEVIERLNERFSTDFTDSDAVKFESLASQMSENPTLQEQAAANDIGHFEHAFDEWFTAAIVDWMKDSEDLAVRLLDDPEFASVAKSALVRIVHRQAAERHRADAGS